jgi:ferric hydroxamate transport system permease protein
LSEHTLRRGEAASTHSWRAAPARRLRVAGVAALGTAGVVLLAAVHLTQGTAAVDAGDLWALVTGTATDQAAAVVVASRIPRLLAGLVVGVALGAAGAALQSVARNSLAAPDTLGVNAGAHLAVVAAAVVGFALPLYAFWLPWRSRAGMR